MSTSGCDDVARRAYELFLARGAAHGLDLDDWLEAERQLAVRTETPPRQAATATRGRRRTAPLRPAKRG